VDEGVAAHGERDVSRLGESYATSPFLALLEIRVKEDKILLSSMNLDF